MTPAAMVDLDEATVVARAQDGDLEAFERLVDDYQAPLFRLAVRMVDDRHLAEDIVQDALVAAWRKLPTLAEPRAFRGWLYQIVTFRALDVLRRQRADPVLIDGHDIDVPASQTQQKPLDPAGQAEQHAVMRALSRYVAALPVEQRLCWLLRDVHGLSYREIAVATSLPVSTVRGRLARARSELNERMAPWR